jgi:hypothetical protein
MALMDMVSIMPLFNALHRLLRPQGRFVFSLTHPCFNTTGSQKVVEEDYVDGRLISTYAVKVIRYKSLGPGKGLGVIGQPLPQYYFDRTLSTLFGAFFAAGFVLDGLEEPAFTEATADPDRVFSWDNFPEIPPVLVARVRPVGVGSR